MHDARNLIERSCEQILQEERSLLDDLVALARDVDPTSPDADNALALREHLNEPFLLVVVGEVKSGKSSFINALLGRSVCGVGPTPLTDRIHLLRYGEQEAQRSLEEHLVERRLPLEILRDLTIVDTPGTNSIVLRHGQITERFIPRSDLILFVTSVDRPYSETENRLLGHISDHWRKKVVFLVSKIDGRSDGDVRAVTDYVRRSCLEHHGFEPLVLPLSARLEEEAAEHSGFTAVRALIRDTLGGAGKLRLQLASTLQAALTVSSSLERELVVRQERLEEDHRWVQALDRQIDEGCRRLKEGTHQFLTSILEHSHACEARAVDFMTEKLRLRSLGLLGNSDRLEEQLTAAALGGHEKTVTTLLQQAVDWLIREELLLHERATSYLQERLRHREGRNGSALPRRPGAFEYRRERIVRLLEEHHEQLHQRLDLAGESRRLLTDAQRALTRQLLWTAIGILAGAASVTFVRDARWVAVGVAAGSLLVFLGLLVLPRVRRRAIQRFRARMEDHSRQLRDGFLGVMDQEIQSARQRLCQGWEAFFLFYRAESSALTALHGRLRSFRRRSADLEQALTGP